MEITHAQQGGPNTGIAERFSDLLFTGLNRYADVELARYSQRREIIPHTVDPVQHINAPVADHRANAATPVAEKAATMTGLTQQQIIGGLLVFGALLVMVVKK